MANRGRERDVRMWLFLVVVALITGIVLGRIVKPHFTFVAGYACLGLVSGMALGLSASPVLGATITGVFTLAAVVIPILLKNTSEGAPSNQPSPRCVGTTAPVHLIAIGEWLFPLAMSLVLGMLVGVAMRVNDALNFEPADLRERYRAQGFSEKQVEMIMSGQTNAMASSSIASSPIGRRNGGTSLQSDERGLNWASLLEY